MLSSLSPALALAAYLIGSIPCGLLIGKFFGLGDIRKVGSGNIGATNMVRAGGKKLGALTLLLDACKGIAVVIIAAQIADHPSPGLLYAYGLIAVVGHCYPIWLKFNGGKGVATTLGIIGAVHINLFPQSWTWLLLVAALWIGMYKATRKVSIASLVTFTLLPFFTYYLYGIWVSPLMLALVIFIRHRENIQRLLNGTEHGFVKTP